MESFPNLGLESNCVKCFKNRCSETPPGPCPKEGKTPTPGSSDACPLVRGRRPPPIQGAEHGNSSSRKPSASIHSACPSPLPGLTQGLRSCWGLGPQLQCLGHLCSAPSPVHGSGASEGPARPARPLASTGAPPGVGNRRPMSHDLPRAPEIPCLSRESPWSTGQ